jgi:hypothetical protein
MEVMKYEEIELAAVYISMSSKGLSDFTQLVRQIAGFYANNRFYLFLIYKAFYVLLRSHFSSELFFSFKAFSPALSLIDNLQYEYCKKLGSSSR